MPVISAARRDRNTQPQAAATASSTTVSGYDGPARATTTGRVTTSVMPMSSVVAWGHRCPWNHQSTAKGVWIRASTRIHPKCEPGTAGRGRHQATTASVTRPMAKALMARARWRG